MRGLDSVREVRRSARRAVATTFAPAAASTWAKRHPSPDEAPVTTAVRPVRSNAASGSRVVVGDIGFTVAHIGP